MSITSQQRDAALPARSLPLLPLYAVTLCLSAFLLFSVQPFFAKMTLPRLGGSPAVWSVAMVFFQAMLLAGYGYAHLLTRYAGIRTAAIVHGCVIILAFVALPTAIPAGWDQPPEAGQAVWLLGLFATAVGLPFFAVSANGPLLQAWFARTGHPHAADPYFLYGASNIGSFASLILYIVLIEPLATLPQQSMLWTGGFALLALLLLACASTVARARASAHASREVTAGTEAEWLPRLQWLALGFVPSGLLVAVTAHISLDIAAAPFLWVVPLSLFLLTFVIVFRRDARIRATTLARAVPVLGALTLVSIYAPALLPVWAHLVIQLAFFLLATLHCHALLYAIRPEPQRLTGFYLWMSLGGVLGGAFASLAAPHLFDWVGEYFVLVMAAMVLGLRQLPTRRSAIIAVAVGVIAAALLMAATRSMALSHQQISAGLALLVIGVAGIAAVAQFASARLYLALLGILVPAGFLHASASGDLFRERSFFGIVRVAEVNDGRYHMMMHGSTVHGAEQVTDAAGARVSGRPEPLTYYHQTGGMADAVKAMQERRGGAMPRVGAVGLGTGSIVCHARPGENWTFYEIDRSVVNAAADPKLFRFMSDCGAGTNVVLGDARLTLAQEPAGVFDFLLIDAFSSDSIPTHLMTREAVQMYRSRLKPDGMLVFHITNRYLELESVLAAVAAEEGMQIRSRFTAKETGDGSMVFGNRVAVLARNEAALGRLAGDPEWRVPGARDTPAWTDDYSNIFTALLRNF